jgi:transcriptional regulator with AAA-type ATPase domain
MLGGQQGAINRAIAHLKTAAKLGAPHEAAIAHARNALLELQSGHPEQAREALSRAQDCSDAGAPEIREGTIEVCWARYRVLAELGDAANAKSALRDATNYLARIISELDAADRESALTRWPNREVAEAAVHVLGTQYEYLGARRADMSVVAASLERFAGGQPNLTSLESLLVDLLALTRGSRIGLAIWKDGLITWPVFRTSGGALVTPNEAIESFTRLVCQSGVEHFEPEKEEATQVGWPLSYGGEVLGAIIVDSHEAFSWTADIQFALRSLVATAALATKVRAQSIELESVQEQVVRELTRTQERLRSETSRRERAERAVEAERHNIRLAHNYDQIIHRSRVMAELLSQLDRLVDRKATVLVVGESGTGKELIARALHHHGVRASGPFVALNCGAVPESLIESELFGHVKGAFTGAHRDRVGQFELANKGTLFLDEIGEIAPAMQVRLLRVLETGAVTKVGSSREVPTDTRIVAATNRDLAAEVEAGRFRQDLFYRLNVVMLRVPPLRERPEDIEPLIHHFAEALAVKNGERAVTFDSLFIERLMGHHWPGNVRELRNVVEYATLFAEDGRVPSDLSLPFKPKM